MQPEKELPAFAPLLIPLLVSSSIAFGCRASYIYSSECVYTLYVPLELKYRAAFAATWLKVSTPCGDQAVDLFLTGLERVDLTDLLSRYLHFLSVESSTFDFLSRQVCVEPEHQFLFPAAQPPNPFYHLLVRKRLMCEDLGNMAQTVRAQAWL